MRLFPTFALIAGMLVFSEITLGHGTAIHDEENQVVEQTPVVSPSAGIPADDQSGEAPKPRMDEHSVDEYKSIQDTNNVQPMTKKPATLAKPDPVSRLGDAFEDFTFADFPTLHPMVVHVPVIMIPIAFLFGLIGVFIAHRHFALLAVAFASAGVLGGFIAAFPMHPHTRGLSEAALVTLQQHDFFAYSTLGLTSFSVVVGAIALLKPNLITKGLLAFILLLASLCVSVTAHYGGTLTYVHGVGVNGNYLDTH